jgi:hypothetical protein
VAAGEGTRTLDHLETDHEIAGLDIISGQYQHSHSTLSPAFTIVRATSSDHQRCLALVYRQLQARAGRSAEEGCLVLAGISLLWGRGGVSWSPIESTGLPGRAEEERRRLIRPSWYVHANLESRSLSRLLLGRIHGWRVR